MNKVRKLQQSIYRDYAKQVGLSSRACYLHGNLVRPVVPLDVGLKGIFIVGAYPSARFELLGGVPDVPVADNLGPFQNERWFDGSRVREQPSARELDELFLAPLGLDRAACWITDLVKVFLFKEGHVKRYRKLDATAPAGYERERFYELGKRSVAVLEDELRLARPRLVITLGAEVAGVLRGVRSWSAQVAQLVSCVRELTVGDTVVEAMHCAHPGNLMRNHARNPWPSRHRNEFLPALEQAIRRVGP